MSARGRITTPVTEEYVFGAVELERTGRGLMPHRLTAAARRQVNGPVEPKVFSDPSGVRLRLRTAGRQLSLTTWPVKVSIPGAPLGPAPVYDVWCDGRLHAQLRAEGGTLITEDPDTGAQLSREETTPDVIAVADLPPGEKLIEMWLPYQEWTELISIDSDEPIRPAPYPPGTLRWVHHGSSISHGHLTVGASHAWPAVTAEALNEQRPVDLLNLGFAGNAKLDQFTARTIRETAAEVITLKLGINIINGDSHTLRSFTPAVHGFLDTIREGLHADTPILVVSPLWCGIHEQAPGPVVRVDVASPNGPRSLFRAAGDPGDKERLNLHTLRAELRRIIELRAEEDANLHFLSGLRLYAEDDSTTHPLPDDLHPDTATHRLIGQRFADHLLSACLLPPAAG